MKQFVFIQFAMCMFAAAANADQMRMLELTRQAIALPSNEIEKKLELYTAAIQEFSKHYLPWTNRAVCYLNYGQWDLAIADATTAVGLAPENSHTWGVRGRAYAGKREFEKAFADLGRALELAKTDEESRNLYNDRGNAYYSARDYEKANRDYQQALRIDPRFAKAYNNLANSLRAQGKLDAAYLNFDRAVRLDSRAALMLVNRARWYVARSDKLMAAADFNRAVELDPSDPSARLHRGMFLYANGNLQDARADFNAALQKSPNDLYACIWRYLVQANLDLRDDARVQLQAQVEKQPLERWPAPLVKLFLGKAKPAEVLQAAARVDNPEQKKERLAEANYYLAQYHLLDGAQASAKQHLANAAELNVPRVQEQLMAKLALVGWKAPQPPPPKQVPSTFHVTLR